MVFLLLNKSKKRNIYILGTYLHHLFGDKMLIKKDFLNKLKDLGLNSYESRLWVALLSRGVSTAGELSDIANVPRSRSYDVLESLEKKGFIIMKIGKPIKYIAVPPSEVIDRVKKRIEIDTKEQITSLEQINNSKVIEELKTLHEQGVELVDPIDLSGAVKGRHNLYNHIESLMKESQKSILIATSADGLKRKTEAFKKQFAKAKERGVKIKIIVPEAEGADAAKELKGLAEIKEARDIKARFVVIDGKNVTFMISDDSTVHPTYDSAVWTSSEYFSSAMQTMFERIWNTLK